MNRFVLRRIVELDARAQQLEDRELHSQAVSLREEVCRLVHDHLGANHLWRLSRLLGLAATCRRSGDLRRAEALYEDAIRRLDERQDDTDRSPPHDLARGLNALGVLYCETERHARAVGLFERALAISQDPPAAPARAAILSNLAGAHHALGHFDKAEACYLGALKIHQQAGEETLLEQAHCHCDLAELAADAERHGDSERRATEALALCRGANAGSDPSVAEALVRLARVYRRLGRPAQAVALLEETVEILQQAGSSHEQELARCLDQMSELRQTRSPSIGSDG